VILHWRISTGSDFLGGEALMIVLLVLEMENNFTGGSKERYGHRNI
jgi:hypothetical protein